MRRIAIISPDEGFLKQWHWNLEQAGYAISLAGSLEEAFLEMNQIDPFLIIVDSAAMRDKVWQAQKILTWFNRRSALVCLGDESGAQSQGMFDQIFPRNTSKSKLLAWIELHRAPL
ncbi:MAG: hypothetical protein HY645_05285 [Acidobacteria bacterium]|nr:hypothetical protein [Acidobacteriota bacterium]